MLKEKLINDKREDVIEVVSLPSDIENGKTYAIIQPNPNSYTHGYFKYPCKFIPEIPRWVIKRYIRDGNSADILDPFSGSGTTLLESAINGHNAYGTEIDNFAKLLIKVKTTPLQEQEIDYIREWTTTLIRKHQKTYKDYKDPFIPQITNLTHWFSEDNVQKLGVIKREISKLKNQRVVDFLSVCLASSVRKCSNADDVSPKPYVSNKIKKVASDPFLLFPKILTKYLDLMEKYSLYALDNDIGNVEMLEGDALNIKTERNFNIAITSPPYINAFDYSRTLRLENLLLDLESEETIRSKKIEYVGTENIVSKQEEQDLSILDISERLKEVYYNIEPIDKKRAIIVKKFFEDMRKNLKEVYNLLVNNGVYCIVIGDSSIRNVNVESWSIICEVAESVGFKIDAYFGYVIQNHYLRIPRGKRGGKITKDYVVVLKKST